MKDEIKEINIPENVLVALGDLTNGALNYYKTTETVKIRHNTILNYITNLQEENEKFNNIINETENIIDIEMNKMGYAKYDSCLMLMKMKIKELKGSEKD